MRLDELIIPFDRTRGLILLTEFIKMNSVDGVKSVRLDHVPLDKRGDIMDLVVYIFRDSGSYELFFPKRIRMPIKSANQEEFTAAVVASMEKIVPSCSSILSLGDVEEAKAKVMELIPSFVERFENEEILKIDPLERVELLFDRGIRDGTLKKMGERDRERREAARARLEAAFKEFDAMTDEEFRRTIMENVELCNSDSYFESMLPVWREKGIQFDVTQTLHDLTSLISERGDNTPPAWGKG